MAIDFACAECGRKLRVADAHAGRRVTCPKCGHRVRAEVARQPARVLAAVSDHAGDEPVSSGFDSAFDSPMPPPLSADDHGAFADLVESLVEPASAPPPPENDRSYSGMLDVAENWYLRVAENEFGPLSKEELDAWVDQGRVDQSCQVCIAGIDWRMASEVYPDLANPLPTPVAIPVPRANDDFVAEVPRAASVDVEQISATLPGATLEQLDQADSSMSNQGTVAPAHFPTRRGSLSDGVTTSAPSPGPDSAAVPTDFSWGGETHWRQPVSASPPRLAEVPRPVPASAPFLRGLVDSSFQRRITPQIIRFVYGSTLIGASLLAVASLAIALLAVVTVVRAGTGYSQLILVIPGLISVAAGLLIMILVVRLLCEAALHLLRIAEACDRTRR